MIEVEKKFLLTEEEIEKLLLDAVFLEEIELEDVYYDKESLELIKADKYLRKRNGKYEFKIPVGVREEFDVDRYFELEDEDSILKELNLEGGSIEKEMSKVGLVPLATIRSVRRKYKHGDFGIDIDKTDFGYSIVEIEVMIPEEESTINASHRIVDFALSIGLEVAPEDDVRGKLLEYLYREKRGVYDEVINYWRSVGATRL